MKKARGLSVLVLVSGLIVIICILALLIVRVFSERHLDDVSPRIQCDEALLKEADVYYVIPKFEGVSISDDLEWCNKIKSYGKRLAMHGVTHEYLEFERKRSLDYLQDGEVAFEDCFGYSPEEFKPPQLAISKENLEIVKKRYKVRTYFWQVFHKTYHCMDSGALPNWVQRLI